MIYSHTLKELTEEELSVLFFICERFLACIGLEIKYDYLKMLRLDVVLRMIDVLKAQALDDKKIIFDNLKNKLAQQ